MFPIHGDDLSVVFALIIEDDVAFDRTGNYVGVGDNVSGRVQYKSGAHALELSSPGPPNRQIEELFENAIDATESVLDLHEMCRRNIDDRALGGLEDLHHRRPTHRLAVG